MESKKSIAMRKIGLDQAFGFFVSYCWGMLRTFFFWGIYLFVFLLIVGGIATLLYKGLHPDSNFETWLDSISFWENNKLRYLIFSFINILICIYVFWFGFKKSISESMKDMVKQYNINNIKTFRYWYIGGSVFLFILSSCFWLFILFIWNLGVSYGKDVLWIDYEFTFFTMLFLHIFSFGYIFYFLYTLKSTNTLYGKVDERQVPFSKRFKIFIFLIIGAVFCNIIGVWYTYFADWSYVYYVDVAQTQTRWGDFQGIFPKDAKAIDTYHNMDTNQFVLHMKTSGDQFEQLSGILLLQPTKTGKLLDFVKIIERFNHPLRSYTIQIDNYDIYQSGKYPGIAFLWDHRSSKLVIVRYD